MSSGVSQGWLEAPTTQEQFDQVLPEILRRLREALDPVTVCLYGSCACGKIGPNRDVGLLVVVDDSELSFFERGALAYNALRRIGVPVDVQVYAWAEFDARAALPVSFERTVISKGRVLYAA